MKHVLLIAVGVFALFMGANSIAAQCCGKASGCDKAKCAKTDCCKKKDAAGKAVVADAKSKKANANSKCSGESKGKCSGSCDDKGKCKGSAGCKSKKAAAATAKASPKKQEPAAKVAKVSKSK
ncbi:MAG: hypothetical protein L3J82_00385 [Planctomycetes bacterium]|nr:hypothetical protein [Planctomycetota bacterium]